MAALQNTAQNRTKPAKRKSFWGKAEFKRTLIFLTMMAPGTIFLLIFNYLPMPGIIMAFKRYKLAMPPKGYWLQNPFIYSVFVKNEWVGLDNFKFLFSSPDALMITRNTVLYNLAFMFFGLLASVGLAIAINELIQRRAAKFYQTIFFMPYFLSWIVVSYLVYSMLNTEFGVFNGLLRSFGKDPIQWYAQADYWPWIIVLANLWKYTGNGSIIYMATITGFDPELYEAAAIDGASKWQQTWRITIPQLIPIIVLLQILAIGRMFSADFALFYALPNGSGPLRDVTTVIDVYVFNTLRLGQVHMGMPAAAGLYQSTVGFILILATNLIVRKIQPEMALF